MVTYWVQTMQWIERRDFAVIFIFSKPHRDFADFFDRDFNTSLRISYRRQAVFSLINVDYGNTNENFLSDQYLIYTKRKPCVREYSDMLLWFILKSHIFCNNMLGVSRNNHAELYYSLNHWH